MSSSMVLSKIQVNASSDSPLLDSLIGKLCAHEAEKRPNPFTQKLLAMKEKREKADLVFLTVVALELQAEAEISELLALQVSLHEVEVLAAKLNCQRGLAYLAKEKKALDTSILENNVAIFEKYIAQNKHWLFYRLHAGQGRNAQDKSSALALMIQNNKRDLLSHLLKLLAEKTKLSQKEIIDSCRLAHMAIDLEARGSLELLLESGIEINHAYKRGGTLLHHAVRRESGMIPFLLEKGASPKILDEAQNSVLHVACESNLSHAEIDLLVKESNLLQKNNQSQRADEIDKSSYFKAKKNRLLTAIKQGNLPVIEQYAAQNLDWLKIPLENDRSALLVAAQFNQLASFDKVLNLMSEKSGVSPKEIVDNTFSTGETWRFTADNLPRHNAISLAVSFSAAKIVDRLLALRADLNMTFSLHCAVYQGESETALKLIRHGARLIEKLRSQRADEIRCAYFRQNCLHLLQKELLEAAINRETNVIEWFLAQNKDWLILPLNEENQSLLHLLAYYNHSELIARILANEEYAHVAKSVERDAYSIYPHQYSALNKNEIAYGLLQREDQRSLVYFQWESDFVVGRFKKRWPLSLSQQALKNPLMIPSLMEAPQFVDNISQDSIINLIAIESTIVPLLLEDERSRVFLIKAFAKNQRLLLDFILRLPRETFLRYEPILKGMIVESSLSFFEKFLSYLSIDYAKHLKAKRLHDFVQRVKEENNSHAALLYGLIMDKGLFEQSIDLKLAATFYQKVLPEAEEDYFEAQYGLAQIAYLEQNLASLKASYQNMIIAGTQENTGPAKLEHLEALNELLELGPILMFKEKAGAKPSKEAEASLQNGLPGLKP